nr:hypothetical protein [Bacillus pacificus]
IISSFGERVSIELITNITTVIIIRILLKANILEACLSAFCLYWVFAYTAKEGIIGEWLKGNINIGIIIQIAIKIPAKL